MPEDINQAISRLRAEIEQLKKELKGYRPKNAEYREWVRSYHSNIMLMWEISVYNYSVKELFSIEDLRKIPTRIVDD